MFNNEHTPEQTDNGDERHNMNIEEPHHAEHQLTQEITGAKGFSKIEPKKSERLDTHQSADQVEGGNEEMYNTGRLSEAQLEL